MKRIPLILLWILCAVEAMAGDYYVSSDSALTAWTTCVDAAHPCAVATALTNATAGDIVHFAAGTYNAGTGLGVYGSRCPLWQPSHSGTSEAPITFKSDVPLAAEVTCTGATNVGHSDCIPFGAYDLDYITWDGFKVTSDTQPTLYAFRNTTHGVGIVFKNIELVGYAQPNGGDNVAGIHLDGTQYAKVQNCYIHGCIDPVDPGGDVSHSNTAAIHSGMTVGTSVENCTFSNNSLNIYSKYGGTSDTYKYNLFLPPAIGNYDNCFVQNYAGNVTGMDWHQNIFVGGISGLDFNLNETTPNDFVAYNNTYYGQTGAAASAHAALVMSGGQSCAWSTWNNLVYKTTPSGMIMWTSSVHEPTLVDYNGYYISSGAPAWIKDEYDTICSQTSLANWISVCGVDVHSVSSDPGFLNGSRSWNAAADFKRASYPANGRGGAYASVMGAYITGSEIIGYSSGLYAPWVRQ